MTKALMERVMIAKSRNSEEIQLFFVVLDMVML